MVTTNEANDIELKSVDAGGKCNEIEPTAEELSSLEHVADRIPLVSWLIVMCELCERFAFYGITGPFQNYIQFPVPGPDDKQPGALNRGQQIATLLTTFFQFFCYLTPIAGAIIADQFWGKYRTIFAACLIYLFGLVVLVLTSIPASIHAGVALPGLIVAMIFLGLATGGVKSNVSPLMAEQYTRTKPVVRGKRVLDHRRRRIHCRTFTSRNSRKTKDRRSKHVTHSRTRYSSRINSCSISSTIQSLFNWFYWAINLGALSSIVTTNVEKYHSFWLAFLIPLIVFNGSIIVLLVGRRRLVRAPPNGSLLVRAFRTTKTAVQMRWTLGKQDAKKHILDYAKDENNRDSDQFIDELKQAIRACRVFAFYPFYWICYNQLVGNLTSQAAQMNVGKTCSAFRSLLAYRSRSIAERRSAEHRSTGFDHLHSHL
jgi:proton-dependent oligopeptide transporter, POT family